ncbi:biotin--[acetyl-CoA-carboxylase] ligase [Thiomicrorhabdus lithotrophica]|uniref:Biotin--[acetyl-CoA-carboxylase] ligase n=1 Tax=Thiomicrorhabdus lithotrophica TaxID=2949997 RepID=A0ABY8CBU6_9GAMM|nr:biotin--[acetyl-CoA-carboxylase] ligase [Thiomicrorhabdus lithotrophica]WEJ63459.1 biotin--[acetyl-CoA-carboxylase] ligase [Thiomicrorhabdus lithotrophica]
MAETSVTTIHHKNYDIISLESVDSTSRFLKDYVSEKRPNKPLFCTTKNQTAGYGQQKRSWLTNEKSAIFSLAFPVDKDYVLSGLVSLHIASLLHQTLTELTAETLYLKWPNDIFNDSGKVAGILIEQVIKKDYRAFIIGIGINRDASAENPLLEGSSLVKHFDLEVFFQNFFKKIQQSELQNYSQQELAHYWQLNDLFRIDETVKLISPDIEEQGIYLGVNPQGQAVIKLPDTIKILSSGQTSIRKIL